MARSYPAPDAFPGSASQPDREPDNFDYDVPPDPAVIQTVTPGNKGPDQGYSGSTNPFPGFPGSQPGGGSGAGGMSGGGAGDVVQTTNPSRSGSTVGGMRVLNAPDAFPGGGQIPASPDTTGLNGQVPRLRRDNSAGGTMP